MTQLTYYPEPQTEPGLRTFECAAGGCTRTGPDRYCTACAKRLDHIRHGYTLHDLEQMTRAAVIADRLMAMPSDERKNIAWEGIVDALFAAQDRRTGRR